MGATGVYSLKGHKKPKDYFDHILTAEDESGSNTVLKSAVIGRVWYGAIQRTLKPTGSTYVIAGIISFSYRPKDPSGEILVYKTMDETMGPVQAQCPPSILKLLTDPLNEYAKEWRDQCRANHKPKASVKGLTEGVKIRLETPIKTRDGRQIAEFTVRKFSRGGRTRTVYISSSGEIWRLTRIDKRPFTVIETPKKTEA